MLSVLPPQKETFTLFIRVLTQICSLTCGLETGKRCNRFIVEISFTFNILQIMGLSKVWMISHILQKTLQLYCRYVLTKRTKISLVKKKGTLQRFQNPSSLTAKAMKSPLHRGRSPHSPCVAKCTFLLFCATCFKSCHTLKTPLPSKPKATWKD